MAGKGYKIGTLNRNDLGAFLCVKSAQIWKGSEYASAFIIFPHMDWVSNNTGTCRHSPADSLHCRLQIKCQK